MKGAPQISDAEWEVMKIVWEKSPILALEVAEQLTPRFGWHARTVKTMLNRLVRKGALAFEVDGKSYLYRPRVTREACVREESRSFLSRVFEGSRTSLLAHFVQDGDLTAEDLAGLKALLEGRKE